jgi:hypothetical protein
LIVEISQRKKGSKFPQIAGIPAYAYHKNGCVPYRDPWPESEKKRHGDNVSIKMNAMAKPDMMLSLT